MASGRWPKCEGSTSHRDDLGHRQSNQALTEQIGLKARIYAGIGAAVEATEKLWHLRSRKPDLGDRQRHRYTVLSSSC
jgi:hypothetical protein